MKVQGGRRQGLTNGSPLWVPAYACDMEPDSIGRSRGLMLARSILHLGSVPTMQPTLVDDAPEGDE